MPEFDSFGKKLPKPPYRVISLACGGCADLKFFLSTASASRPLVFVSADPDAALHSVEISRTQGAWLVADPEAKHVPRSILDYPPVALKVARDGKVQAQESLPQRIGPFLGATAEPETASSKLEVGG